MPPGQVIVFIIGMIVVIFGAYYVTYYISLKASGQSRGGLKNRSIIMIDRFAISKDKCFCLVEIAGKVYLIGVTNQSMTLLDTLDAAAFSEKQSESADTPDWFRAPGGRFTGKLTRSLASFLAGRIGRAPIKHEPAAGETFAESMKTAHEKKRSGQPDSEQAKQTDHLEDET